MIGALVVGCGGKTASVQDPHNPPPTAGSAGLPVGAPLAPAGEKFSYLLELQGVELATYDFAVGDVVDWHGKTAVQVQSHAKAIGLVKIVANVDDFFTSWIDVKTGRPLHWMSDEFATKSSDRERTDVQLDQRGDTNVIPVDFHINNDPPKPEPQKVSFPEVWDYNSLMIAFRSWEAPVGSSVEGEVFRSRYMWHYKITIKGKDKLTTALGDFPALRIDGHVFKVNREDVPIASDDERDFTIWISDDAGRVPLKIVAKTDYGDIKMTITSYDAGASGK